MKRFFALLLLVLVAMSLFVGCNSEVDSNTLIITLDDLDTSKFIKKTVNLYVPNTENSEAEIDGTIPVYFTSDDSSIPYVRLTEIIDVDAFKENAGSLFDSLSLSAGSKGNDVVLTNTATGETMEVDTTNKKFIFSDYDRFFNSSSAVLCNEAVNSSNYLLKKGIQDVPAGKFEVSYGDYEIPVYTGLVDGKPEVLLPFKTLCDLSRSFTLQKIAFNGKDFYYASYNNIVSKSVLTGYGQQYFNNGFTSRNTELIDFNYKELVFNLDLNYGLKERQGISSFDQSLTGWGLKKMLYSTDSKTSSQAISNLVFGCLGDIHSSYGSMTPFTEEFSTQPVESLSPSYESLFATELVMKFARSEAFGDGTYPGFQIIDQGPYNNYAGEEQSSVTAFITFDSFVASTTALRDVKKIMANEYVKSDFESSGFDTIDLIVYANQAIKDWDSDHDASHQVKNVVVDLSCNTGGNLNAGAFLCAWLLGNCPYSVLDSATGSKSTAYYYADVNMDGVYSTGPNSTDKNYYNDTVSDKNIYILTSQSSFSCGNAVPYVVKASRRGTLIGTWSAGGACGVLGTCTADGTLFNISSARRLCYESNGSFVDFDNGIDVDYKLSNASEYYDRGAIVNMINNRILIKNLDLQEN